MLSQSSPAFKKTYKVKNTQEVKVVGIWGCIEMCWKKQHTLLSLSVVPFPMHRGHSIFWPHIHPLKACYTLQLAPGLPTERSCYTCNSELAFFNPQVKKLEGDSILLYAQANFL